MKRILLLTSLAFILLSAVPDQERPNFLLITIDTWRADYISASGSGKVATPFMDKLANEGSYIKRVDTPAPITTPAHASILTGLYPVNHGIRDNSHFRLKDGVRTMAQLFHETGYRTIAVVSAAPLKRNYRLNRGFDIYDDSGIGADGDDAVVSSSRDGKKSADRALKEVMNSPNKKMFVWLHLYDPHYPYTPPYEYAKRYPKDPYAGEVAYTDGVIGDFVTGLMKVKKGKWVILVTGDHGEGLGEKSEETHGFLLYSQTREVPLILWDSEKKTAPFGTGIKNLIDIFPTVAELFSLRRSGCDGISLFQNSPDSRWLFSETLCPTASFGLNPAFYARKGEDIYIRHGTSMEVYRGTDENKNLYQTRKGYAEEAETEIQKYSGDGQVPAPSLKLTEEEMKALSGLGYIGSSFQIPHKVVPCDLREFSMDFSRYLSRGKEEQRKGRLDAALQCYDMIIKKYPRSSMLHYEKGELLARMNRLTEAKREFQTCLGLDPQNSLAMLNLGNIMKMEGKYEEAERLYLSSLSCEEDQAAVYLNLGILYSESLKNKELALKNLRRFLELAPDYPKRNEIENYMKNLNGPR